MHLVRVLDPWFGLYYRVTVPHVTVPGGYIVVPVVTIGPLTDRVIRLESLQNHGLLHRDGHFKERPCQHSYVDGVVTGVTPDLELENSEFLVRPGSTNTVKTFNIRVGLPSQLSVKIEVDIEWIETTAHVSANICVAVSYMESSEMDYTIAGISSCVIHSPLHKDPYTDAVTYTDFHMISRSDPSDPHFSCGFVPNPYITDGVDNLGDSYKGVVDYINYAISLLPSVKSHKNTRDKALYAALDNLSLSNINWLETTKDLVGFMETVRSFVNLFKVPKSLSALLKGFANFHLFWRYVYRTTLMDLKDFRNMCRILVGKHGGLIRFITQSVMYGRGDATIELPKEGGVDTSLRYSIKVCYGPDISSLSKMLSRLTALRLVPRLMDIWDLIPYSFVVDWMIPVSDAIDNLEKMSAQQALPFIYMIVTRKVQYRLHHDFVVNDHSFTIDVKVVDYERTVLHEFPSDVWLGVSFSDPRKQKVTAAALLIQRFLR